MIVLGINATAARLEPHIDVLGDQHHLLLRALLFEHTNIVNDLVVIEVSGKYRQVIRRVAHQDGERAQRLALVAAPNRHALFHIFR